MNGDIDQVIRAAVQSIVNAALQLIESDPHQFSARPCPTCAAVTSLAGRPFGCIALFSQKAL